MNMTREAWNAYARHAWGQHDLHPLSLSKQEAWLAYSGQSLVGSMSTLWLMGLKEEFNVARRWVEKEMIIDDRCLPKIGALLSTYALTGDELFKNKAREIADLYSPTGKWLIGYRFWTKDSINFKTNQPIFYPKISA